MSYNENTHYVENLITPPPKTSRRMHYIPTDHKQSGIKYIQNESIEKYGHIDHHGYISIPPPFSAQYAQQVIFKSHKYKHTSIPYLIPFCNKCNLPPILPIHPDFEMEIVPPPPIAQPVIEREKVSPVSLHTPAAKPKYKPRSKKKSSIDENGKRIIRRRKRKTYEQLQMLIQEFQSNPEWSKDNMQDVSKKTGLSEAQVYKWGWDQKRKMLDPTRDITDELRLYKEHELESEDAGVVQKLKFQSSQKKQSKNHTEHHKEVEKHESTMKTRKSAAKESKFDNKENEYTKNMSSKTETRGVRRKLKAFGESKNHV